MNAISVPQLTERVVDALAVVIDVNVSNEQRRSANVLLEEMKSETDSVVGIQVALNLMNGLFIKVKPVSGINETNKEVFAQTVRHFGLQLIENIIKFKWSSLNVEKKNELKNLLENILKANENNVSRDIQLKHGLSKCIVECMKREWPQNWPYILDILLSLKRNECVLFIFWRLAEDVGVFYLPNNAQRRRELNGEILLNLNRIMQYISDCFSGTDIHLSTVALQTLTGFLEWCGLDPVLLSFLSDTLGVPFCAENCQVKLLACECLIICLTRKGLKAEERKTLLVLFNESNLNPIIRALRTTLEQLINSNSYSNELFDLSKRLCYVLSLMGQVALSVNSNDISMQSLVTFLETQLEIFTCGNQVLNSLSLQFWRDFIRCQQWSKAFINEPMMNKILSVIPLKLIKQTFDSKYMGYEFDGQEDYEAFYYKFRAEVIEVLRNLTSINEDICFLFSTSLLKTVCHNTTSSKTEWEVISIILDAVCNKLSNIEKFANDGQLIFKYILERIGLIRDPDVTSSQLSCLSALFVFLPFVNGTNVLQQMLDKIFTLALFSIEGQTKQTRSKAVKNLRRHACCAFVKLSRTYPKLLLPLFSGLKDHIEAICVTSDEMSQMEKCTLNEGLLLISNEFEDPSIQQEFINKLISRLTFNVLNTPQFISYVGLDISAANDIFGENRANIIYAVNTVVGLLKRVNRKQVLLPRIFDLIRALYLLVVNLNSLWKPEYQSLVHPEYKSLLFAAITETYRLQLLELPLVTPSAEGIIFKTASHRMQTFLWSLYENAFSALGTAFTLLGPEIYLESLPFSQPLVACENLPDAKLRMILKLYVKPLVSNCPNEAKFHEVIILPVIQNFLPFLFRKINGKWESMKVRNSANHEMDNDLVESELIDEQLCRLLSKDFVELLTNLCFHSKSQKNNLSNSTEDTEMADEVNYQNLAQEAVYSQLGEFILRNMSDVLIISSAVSLTWMDSFVSNKSAVLNSILFKKLITDSYVKKVEEATFLFQQVLTALSYFGEHEQNQAILLQLILILYEGIVMQSQYVGMKEKLAEITGEPTAKWNLFEEKWMKPLTGKGQIPDKKKKEALKSLLDSIIGKNIGQLYKRNKDEIRNLRPIIFNRKKNNSAELETLDLCKLFDV